MNTKEWTNIRATKPVRRKVRLVSLWTGEDAVDVIDRLITQELARLKEEHGEADLLGAPPGTNETGA
jgi:hypothetical protein